MLPSLSTAFRRMALAAALGLAAIGGAQADIIVSTYGNAGTGYQPAGGYRGAFLSAGVQAVANSFTNGAYDVIHAITVEIYGAGPVNLALYADAAGTPDGSALWTSTVALSAPGGQDSAIRFGGLDVAVQRNATYWLLVAVEDGAVGLNLWDYSDNTPTNLATIATLTSSGWTLATEQTVNAFTVEGDVPEPWSGVLLATALALAVLQRRSGHSL